MYNPPGQMPNDATDYKSVIKFGVVVMWCSISRYGKNTKSKNREIIFPYTMIFKL